MMDDAGDSTNSTPFEALPQNLSTPQVESPSLVKGVTLSHAYLRIGQSGIAKTGIGKTALWLIEGQNGQIKGGMDGETNFVPAHAAHSPLAAISMSPQVRPSLSASSAVGRRFSSPS